MEETLVVTGLRTNLTDTWRNSGNARRRQGQACVHRLEDGVKKHRGLTAASSSLRVSRHVTLRKTPSSSVEVPTRAYQPRGRGVPAHAIRSRGCQCALYFCFCRSPCLPCQATTKGLRVQYLRAGSCTHDSAGARMLIRTRNACTFAPSVAPSARMTLLHTRLVRSGQRGAGNIALEQLQMPRQYCTRIFSCMLAPFVAPSARMTWLQIDLMRADNMLRATWRWNYRCHGNTPLTYTQSICGE
jgi:hypothetical protein